MISYSKTLKSSSWISIRVVVASSGGGKCCSQYFIMNYVVVKIHSILLNVQGHRSILLFLLLGLLGSLGGCSRNFLWSHSLDDTDSDSLSHVTYSETSKRGEVREGFDAHGLAWDQFNNTGISGFDEFGVGFGRFTSTTIDLFLDLVKFASNMSSVAIQHWRIFVANLTGVVENNNLGCEVSTSNSWLVLGVRGNVSSLDILD